ncbi:Repeat-companion domain protein OS=Isosphaera pallida (strain ATCC 43644 / DSM 9630 / IS1B) GN=Isop_0391 PE=4 SV=1 [Gemmataceae bacterium]|nr:Repeat-companion domain protein OS=Isosphaera pallida (strain ATCC 43644 / DSM 9630 / IS1B) GN=Isop_0391 PE=4 SV=1 [Gemmataceae bacterium]VTU01329.1 Repeat-companion domain protein OS=Isosphaera pallida (strain ATCC 43644 / DSM 9630 / IS1B) GN=Isop_0391 PE=4 SV=1 [Gemmataceae bacterium]
MSDGDALLAAIIANPDDDTPRLVYADWLDENGQPERAEFIRLQLLSGYTIEQDNRQYDLLEANRKAWSAHSPQSPPDRRGGELWEWVFERGMVEGIFCEADTFLENWPRLTTATPIRHLALYDAGAGHLEDLARLCWKPLPTTLVLGDHPNAAIGYSWGPGAGPGLVAGIRSELARNVRYLLLSMYDISDNVVDSLLAPSIVERLKQLSFSTCSISPKAVDRLRTYYGSRFICEHAL